MRPVERGTAPDGAITYEEMGPTLRDRIGRYCSYCEFPVKHLPHTEHIVPKGAFPALRDRWDNLLIGCALCNSRKPKRLPRPQDLPEYLWPTTDNTARAFTYVNVIPEVLASLQGPLRIKAARLRGLAQLSVPDDDRAKERARVFAKAKYVRDGLAHQTSNVSLREAIVDLALAEGFFSVWMEVFAADLTMRLDLIAKFVGTAPNCFDPTTTRPTPRPGGQL